MNKQIILICAAALLLILFIGCTEFDKCDLDQDGTVSEKELDKCNPPITSGETCGDNTCGEKEKDRGSCPQDCKPTECTDECGNGTCENIVCKKLPCPCLETIDTCPQDCDSITTSDSNEPYSFFAVHFEIDPNVSEADDKWQNMANIVEFANQYNTPLTIMFWPGSAEYAIATEERLTQVREWQAQGHEIGLHNQGCYIEGVTRQKDKFQFYAPSDDQTYLELVGDQELKSGTNSCETYVISTYIYEAGGRPDGRSAVAIKHEYVFFPGHEVYGLNIKAGYTDGTAIKIAQYNTLNSNEIYGFVNHGEGDAGNLGGTKELIEWLEFLYNKDPLGSKRMTQRNIMEEYVLPNNLVASMSDICSSTDTRTQECLQLALTTKPGAIKCISPYNSGTFNFGRCLQTNTYCELENDLSQEQLCEISTGDFYHYVPTSCVIKNISEYQQVPNCHEENIYCPNQICDEKEAASGSCPQDCTN